nr:YHYH domain-containing protein [Photobacterium phosphoreum]
MLSGVVNAHSGGTDSNGCNTNYKTGVYHCH